MSVQSCQFIVQVISVRAVESDVASVNVICRLERLQALADKLGTDCRTCENHIDSLSRRLAEVQCRITIYLLYWTYLEQLQSLLVFQVTDCL